MDLANLYRIRAGLSFARKQLADKIDQQKTLLMYMGELTGKDAEARKREYALAQEKVFLADERLQKDIAELQQFDFQIALNTGEIEAQEAERREAEWSIRRDLASALRGENVYQNSSHGRPDDDQNAFDDSAQAVVDRSTDNIPF